ncbi:MAG: imidazoleglycerol-phosphate dehydratase HisB [Bacillota bacterium]
MNRVGQVKRQTRETAINLELILEGSGKFIGQTGIGFMDHMLTLWTKHGAFDLMLEMEGDLEVDVHHTIEDLGICLGTALKQALGDKVGISRYGTAWVPMDEALVMVSLDLSGRPYLVYEVSLQAERVGSMETEVVEEFLRALVNNAGVTLHVRALSGKNTHHIIEAVFKALGRALAEATHLQPGMSGVPSTKGSL